MNNYIAILLLTISWSAFAETIPDYARAHMWWNIIASQGSKDAVKNRDIVEKKMTSSQIAEAQKLARECVAKDYKSC